MRIRVATRSAGTVGLAEAGGADPIGGNVINGLGVATAAIGDGVGVGRGGAAESSGSAVTGFEIDRRPPARKATPSAVRQAGTILVRIRARTGFIGAAW
jgi:hypothetical protein